MAIYKGFSTINRTKKFRLTDFELVKRDLLNHFNIRRGEKLMNPNFGSIIWESLFDPFTDDLKEKIIDDIKRIAAYELRVSVNRIIVTQYEFGLQVELELTYIPTNQTDVLKLQFDRDSNTATKLDV
jgi:phage baseplate assembly protein W